VESSRRALPFTGGGLGPGSERVPRFGLRRGGEGRPPDREIVGAEAAVGEPGANGIHGVTGQAGFSASSQGPSTSVSKTPLPPPLRSSQIGEATANGATGRPSGSVTIGQSGTSPAARTVSQKSCPARTSASSSRNVQLSVISIREAPVATVV